MGSFTLLHTTVCSLVLTHSENEAVRFYETQWEQQVHTLSAYYELGIGLCAKCMLLNISAQTDLYFHVTDETTEAQRGFLRPLYKLFLSGLVHTLSFKCHL